jgi:hypothetical protein
MKKYIVNSLLLFQLLVTLAFGADRKIYPDSLFVENGDLFFTFHISGLMNEKAVKALERGLTSEIVHHIQLWQSKKIYSHIIFEDYYHVKVYFDNWDEKYIISTPSERRLTADQQTVQSLCTQVNKLKIADSSQVEVNAKYYLSIQTTFQPISDESYHELRNWVAGKVRPEDEDKKKVRKKGTFFGVLLDLMGFGDKEITFKSKDFSIDQNGHLRFLD